MPDAVGVLRRRGGRRVTTWAATLLLVVGGGACADDDDDDDAVDGTAIIEISESTDVFFVEDTPPLELSAVVDPEFIGDVLADDVVTVEELTDAHDRYIDCLVEGGAVGVSAFDLDLRVVAADWLIPGAQGDDQATLDATCRRDYLGDLILRFDEANPPPDDLADRQRASVVACVEAINPELAAQIPDIVTLDTTEQGVSVIDLQLDATALDADVGEVDAVNRCTGMLGADWEQFG